MTKIGCRYRNFPDITDCYARLLEDLPEGIQAKEVLPACHRLSFQTCFVPQASFTVLSTPSDPHRIRLAVETALVPLLAACHLPCNQSERIKEVLVPLRTLYPKRGRLSPR